MRCKICDEVHQVRDSIRDYSVCRLCKYFIEFFSLNGNRLEEYS